MPVNREPRIYQGYVISQIGQSAGARVDMEFKNAQACVMSGTHRWADDETDMPLGLQAEIDKRKADDAARVEADRVHYEKRKADAEAAAGKSVEALIAAKARPIVMAKAGDDVYLARPFPKVTSFDQAFIESKEAEGYVAIGEGGDIDGDIILKVKNAIARYRPLQFLDDGNMVVITAELVDATQPEVDIPVNWREMSHLQTIPLAKRIRVTTEKMTKVEAEAILEEWMKVDVEPEAEAPAAPVVHKPGEGPEAGNRDEKPFSKDADGNELTPEQKAALDAQKFAGGDADDEF